MDPEHLIRTELRELCAEAQAAGKWLHCNYQDILFSPAALRAQNDNGKFLWGPVNWTLVDPMEKVERLRREAAGINAQADRLLAKIRETA